VGVTGAARAPERLVGFDDQGEAFIHDGRVFRGIYPGSGKQVRQVLERCTRGDVFSRGLIATREAAIDPRPDLGYELVLEHERIPFVTFPHEWPASMLRDAALFHTQLFLDLAESGLTLKDWHPYNILFDGTVPRFVDFTSLVSQADLLSVEYLQGGGGPASFTMRWDNYARTIYRMFRITFEPYFAMPLVMMDMGKHGEARARLLETALNSTDEWITRGEAFRGHQVARAAYELFELRLRIALAEKGPVKRRFFSAVLRWIEELDVALTASRYSSYYEEKNEAFALEPSPEWTDKQKAVHGALSRFTPRTVLDLGSNTGWFSILAARMGSSVVAVDLDEASLERLYHEAKGSGLSILPLVVDLTNPPADVPPRDFEHEPSLSRIGGNGALYPAPDKRLACEMVMALAIVHHLALGQGLSFERIGSVFDRLATRYLCAEFVALDDPMVSGEPDFFPAYYRSRDSFGWYTLDNFVAEMQRRFTTVEIHRSHPENRVMVVCWR
jgi:SAM-dependent methyltransferase